MPSRQRAFSIEQKLERREVILNVAMSLLEKTDYHDISVAHIAKKAGLAKGTIFLYFKTKEELFLQLQAREYGAWFEDVNIRLNALSQKRRKCTIREIVKNITAVIRNRPTMIKLTPILHIILERNIDYKTALGFKRFLWNELRTTGRLIERCLPFFRANDGTRFLLHLQVLLIGLIQLSRPSQLVREVIQKEGMEAFQIDLEEELTEMLMLIINGMKDIRKE